MRTIAQKDLLKLTSGQSRARIATHGAALGRAVLSRRVGHSVARAGTTSLERVVKSHPVTHFVHEGIAEIVVADRASWHGIKGKNDTIFDQVGRAWERCVAEQITRDEASRVDVEIRLGASAQSRLHGCLLRTVALILSVSDRARQGTCMQKTYVPGATFANQSALVVNVGLPVKTNWIPVLASQSRQSVNTNTNLLSLPCRLTERIVGSGQKPER